MRAARKAAGLSQRKLGLLAGLDESVAGTRLNQYEQDVHQPNYDFMQKVGDILGCPTAYFYAAEDSLAELILLYSKLGLRGRPALAAKCAKAMQVTCSQHFAPRSKAPAR